MSVFRPTLNPGIGPRDDLPDILLTWFIQVTGLAAALIFGVFSILSWVDSQHAKEQAKAANLLAVAAICAQVGVSTTPLSSILHENLGSGISGANVSNAI